MLRITLFAILIAVGAATAHAQAVTTVTDSSGTRRVPASEAAAKYADDHAEDARSAAPPAAPTVVPQRSVADLGARQHESRGDRAVPPMAFILILASAAGISISFAVGVIADKRGRSGTGWFVLSLLLTPVLALLFLVAADQPRLPSCPNCGHG